MGFLNVSPEMLYIAGLGIAVAGLVGVDHKVTFDDYEVSFNSNSLKMYVKGGERNMSRFLVGVRDIDFGAPASTALCCEMSYIWLYPDTGDKQFVYSGSYGAEDVDVNITEEEYFMQSLLREFPIDFASIQSIRDFCSMIDNDSSVYIGSFKDVEGVYGKLTELLEGILSENGY